MYKPAPFDSEKIIIPSGLSALSEGLAENVHETWAAGRIKEGWTYGEKEDPERRISPLLVPYDKLPESEKDYDRRTAMETLKFVIGHSYIIERKENVK